MKTISHISSSEYQKRVWILRKKLECQAFDDLVCDFFDEADEILEKHKDFGITEYQHGVLKKLIRIFFHLQSSSINLSIRQQHLRTFCNGLLKQEFEGNGTFH